MRLFSPKRPAAEDAAERPRKTGFARVLELWLRDLSVFFRAGALVFLSGIPFIAGMVFAVASHAILPALLTGVLGGALAAPQVSGLADTILRSMRDEGGWWWLTYQRAWRRNARASLLPGALFGLIFAAQIFALFHLDQLPGVVGNAVLLALTALISLGLASYCFSMLALMELPFGGLLKNSVLLFLAHLPKSLLAAFWQLLYCFAVLMLWPFSLVALPLTSLWIPMSVGCGVLYPILDQQFHVEEAIGELRRQEREAIRRELEEKRENRK